MVSAQALADTVVTQYCYQELKKVIAKVEKYKAGHSKICGCRACAMLACEAANDWIDWMETDLEINVSGRYIVQGFYNERTNRGGWQIVFEPHKNR